MDWQMTQTFEVSIKVPTSEAPWEPDEIEEAIAEADVLSDGNVDITVTDMTPRAQYLEHERLREN